MTSASQPTGTDAVSPPTGPARPKAGRRVVLLLAIAVFAQESVWNFYDAQVPASLQAYIGSAGVVGLLMGVDNVFGVVVQPLVGHFSDRLKRRRGSRLPVILVTAPVAAVFFVLIPWANSLPVLLVFVISFAFVSNGYKGVTETLLPDYVSARRRNSA